MSDPWEMDNGDEEITGELMAPLPAAPSLPMQRTQGSYVTAVNVQKPRELRRVEKSLMQEVALLGEDAYYGWGAGSDRIEGPSIHLALAALRAWGNCAVEQGPVENLPDGWVFTVYFVDIESGVTLPRKFRQAKGWEVHGKFSNERKDDIRFQLGQSKAIRNSIISALPRWLIQRAIDKAKDGVRKRIEQYIAKHSLPLAQQLIISELAKQGVSEARVLGKMNRPTHGALTIEDLVLLQGDLKALQTGADSVESLFPAPVAESPLDMTKTQTERVKEKLRAQAPPSQPATPPHPTPQAEAAKPEGQEIRGQIRGIRPPHARQYGLARIGTDEGLSELYFSEPVPPELNQHPTDSWMSLNLRYCKAWAIKKSRQGKEFLWLTHLELEPEPADVTEGIDPMEQAEREAMKEA